MLSHTTVVGIGSRVFIHDLRNQDEFSLTLVADVTANDPECIPQAAPIAQALIGASVGDIVSWPTPHGMAEFRITAIDAPEEP